MSVKKSNYDLMRDQMEKTFLNYDQKKMITQYALAHDSVYLYVNFIKRDYRINRNSGRVEWSPDGFLTKVHAGYNESMTIFDILCYAKEGCRPAGRFVPVNQLKGIVQVTDLGTSLFQDVAKRFEHRTMQLSKACQLLGGQRESVGDVSYRLPIFDFLPVIVQFWDSDEEFGPTLKLMWDENILSYMHYETTYFAAAHLWERLTELMESSGKDNLYGY
ncbi:MAG: DUF3786 domain-containing protein [Lachnospiraceae bacterium]|jgi:hypothetical protein|nr:DUF3786 domain-containing protein [Lachnospiraceae bacterium]